MEAYTASLANRVLNPSPPPQTDTYHQKKTAEQAAYKCTDGDMVTLMTTGQQIVTDLQTADTEEDRSAVIMRAVYGLVMWKLRVTISPI
jgi:hypothetical protein